MLRITQSLGQGGTVVLKLEGRVLDEWVAVLEQECRRLANHSPYVVLDCSGVTFMDDLGISAVRALPRKQFSVVHCSDFIGELLAKGER